MPRIRFTADPKLPRDLAHLGYSKGVEVDLDPDQCDRWIRRGVAELASTRKPARSPSKAPPPRPRPEDQALEGSATLPAVIRINDADVQLGTIVAAAFARTGLTVNAWNDLPAVERDKLLQAEIDAAGKPAA